MNQALRYALVIGGAVVSILLFLLASASDNSGFFDRYYPWLLGLNAGMAVLLLVLANGSIKQTFTTLEDALFLIRRPSRWMIAKRGDLKPGETYNVNLRMFMDREYLQKPLQVNAFNNSDWRLASNKKTFTYRAD